MGPVETALRDSLDRIQRYGWAPYSINEDDSRGCVINHVSKAVDNLLNDQQDHAYSIIREAIGEPSIGMWNDRQLSSDAVMAAMNRAIDIARERNL